MFTRHHAGATVKAGTYLNLKSGEFVTMNEPSGRLPTAQGGQFVAASPILALLVGPLAGLAFILFLPLAVPLVVLWTLGGKAKSALPSALSHYGLHLGRSALVAEGISPKAGWQNGKESQSGSGPRPRM